MPPEGRLVRTDSSAPSPVASSEELAGFLTRAAAYGRELERTKGRVRVVRIEDQAARNRIGSLCVALLSDPARARLETASATDSALCRAVLVSAETAVKQATHHPDLTLDEYLCLREVIEYGELSVKDGRLVFFHQTGNGRLYRAIVKAGAEKQVLLVTFHRARPRDRRAARRASRQTPRQTPQGVAHGGARHPAEAGNPTSR